MKAKKIGLALGSGGSRGVAHIGVLKALEEEGIKPDFITGCSMGAVVGACYSAGMQVEDMYETVQQIKPFDLLDLGGLSKGALLKGNKMHDMLLDKIGAVQFDELAIPFRCVATDLLSGKLVVLDKGEVATAVRASSTIPLVFQPVEYEDKLLVDGGVLCRIPTEQVKEMGADVVIAVDVLDNTKEPVTKVKSVIGMIIRVYDIIDYNSTCMKRQLTDDDRTLWVIPDMGMMSQYRIKDLPVAYESGYNTTKALMPQIKKLIKQ
ncbi:MAG: patatin-like phospholipase family protein [Candidatus Coproplasma sp.]